MEFCSFIERVNDLVSFLFKINAPLLPPRARLLSNRLP